MKLVILMKEKQADMQSSEKKDKQTDIRTEAEIIESIKNVINKVRPYLQNDGGDVKFKRFENGIVYVTLVGACSNCPMAIMTLQDGIENALVSEVPEVIKVIGED